MDVDRDVGERRAAGLERSQRERLLNEVVETAQNAFIVIDTDGNVQWWNRAAERILGWTREEAVGRLLAELIVPERLRPAHTEGLHRRAAGHPPRLGNEPVQLQAVRRDGTEIDVEITFGELKWEDGLRFHAFVRDVSEREASRRALEQSEKRFRLAFQNAPIGNLLTNLSQPDVGKLIAANPTVEEMLGYTEAELRQMSLSDITHPDDVAQDAELVPKLLAGELDKIEYEKRYIRKDGHLVWVAQSAIVVRTPEGAPLHTITQIIDITERRASAESMLRLNRELQQANAELDGFTATVAHDLKNPLAAIAGMVEIFDDAPGSRSPDEKRALAALARTTDRMGRMIDDLLLYSRATRAEIAVEQVDLNALVDDAADEVAHSADRPVHVTHDPLPHIHAQPGLFRQVLGNLVGNAVKYVAPGVEPRVHLSVVDDEDAQGWTLRLEDNGIGIPHDARDRVFTMFHREAPESYRGTGIGLATCRKIVERHGGKIWIDAGTVGGGTVVSLWMPRVPRDDIGRTGRLP